MFFQPYNHCTWVKYLRSKRPTIAIPWCVRGVRLCPWNERGLATGKGSKGSEAKKDWGFQSPLVWTTFIDIEIAPLHLVLFILSVDCRAHVAKTNCWKMKRGTREMREGQMGPHIHEGQKAARRRSIEMTVAKKITLCTPLLR